MLFDTHCHLNSEEFTNNIEEVIKRAKNAGITKFLVVGWNKESSLKAIELAEKYDCIYAAIGYHPTDVFNVTDEEFEKVMSYINHPKVVALGEIGLDYHWIKDVGQRDIQKEWFIKQIKVANENKKPISIHSRDAFEETMKILTENKPCYGGVMHCYSGSAEGLKDVLRLGLYIGFDGPLTFNNAKKTKEVASIVPINRVVFETDCPYLAPHPLRGTKNEPKNLQFILKAMSEIKNMSLDEIEKIVFDNSCTLFHV